MTQQLNIAPNLQLPLEAVTQTFSILAKRGAGKSYTAAVMAEEMLAARQQIIALDPTGAWWGLRSQYPVAILGGEHGDIPLEEHAGEVVASAIVQNRFSAVVDLSLFRKGQMIRFMVAFAETLYRLNREPVHLFVDEADAVAPQARNFGGDENRMLGAMEDIVRRGRKRGIGCTLITQRPAVLNKNVLTQCETLIALRLVHPKDIDAIKEWVNVHAEPQQAKEMIATLPSLPIGSAWFWSPGWCDLFRQVQVRPRRTFDSGATPKPGQAVRPPKELAKIDLNALGEQIQAEVVRAKENDPKELKRQIAELKKQLAARPSADPAAIEQAREEARRQAAAGFEAERSTMAAAIERLQSTVSGIRKLLLQDPSPPGKPAPVDTGLLRPAIPATAKPVRPACTAASVVALGNLPSGQRKILTVLAQYPEGRSKRQIAILTGYAKNGGAFNNYLSALRSQGSISGRGEQLVITEHGLERLGEWDPLPTGSALAAYWRSQLGLAERTILHVLLAAYPSSLTKSEVAEKTGYQAGGGGFNNALSKLRTLELIGGHGALTASEELVGN